MMRRKSRARVHLICIYFCGEKEEGGDEARDTFESIFGENFAFRFLLPLS